MRNFPILISLLLLATAVHAEPVVSTYAVLRANAGMSVAADGTLYVADFGNPNALNGTSLYRIDPDGEINLVTDRLVGPSGNLIDADGSILQSEYRRNRVSRISASGGVSLFTTVTGPDDMVQDAAGNLYIASCSFSGGNPGVYRVAAGSATAAPLATSPDYGCVSGVTLDDQGQVYFSSVTNGRVYRRGTDGSVQVFASMPAGAGHIKFAHDQFYVVVPQRNQIMTISRSGAVGVLAGTGAAGNRDGLASQAQFDSPFHIEFSADQRFLFVDGGRNGGTEDSPLRMIDLFPERGAPIDEGTTGAWFDPLQAGHGLFVETLSDNRMLAWWFSFDADGNQAWFGGVGTYQGNVATIPFTQTQGGRFIPNFDPAQVSNPAWGTVTLRFDGCDQGSLEFDSVVAGFGSGSMPLTRLSRPVGLACAPFL